MDFPWQDLSPAEQLLASLIARGVDLFLEGDCVYVRLRRPQDLLTRECAFLQAHELEVVALLQRAARSP
jgi:hypothetical protein